MKTKPTDKPADATLSMKTPRPQKTKSPLTKAFRLEIKRIRTDEERKKFWKDLENLVHSLPYSYLIAAADHFNGTGDDCQGEIESDIDRSLEILKCRAQLGRIDALKKLVTIGNDIAEFLKGPLGDDQEAEPDRFPHDTEIFRRMERCASPVEISPAEPEQQDVNRIQEKLFELIDLELQRDVKEFIASADVANNLYPESTPCVGLSAASMTNRDEFGQIKIMGTRGCDLALLGRLLIIERFAGRVVLERIGRFARQAFLYIAGTATTWPMAVSHARKARLTQVENVAIAVNLGGLLSIRKITAPKRSSLNKANLEKSTSFTLQWVDEINGIRNSDANIVDYTRKPVCTDIPELGSDQARSQSDPSHESEELFIKPSDLGIQRMRERQRRSDWIKNCKCLPELSRDKDVIRKWKKHILDLITMRYPDDWRHVKWPESIQKRIDSKPVGFKSRKRKRAPREAVSDAIEAGLLQLAPKIS